MNEQYYLYQGQLFSGADLHEKYGDQVDAKILEHGFQRAYSYQGSVFGEQDLQAKYGEDYENIAAEKGITPYGFEVQEQVAPEEGAERNPFKTLGKSAWNTLRYQLPGNIAASGAAAAGEVEDIARTAAPTLHEFANQEKNLAQDAQREVAEITAVMDRYNRGLQEGRISREQYEADTAPFIERLDFIKGNKFDKYDPGVIEKTQQDLTNFARDIKREGIEVRGELVDQISEISDPIDALNWTFNAVGQAAGSIAPAILTLGISSVGEGVGGIYLESVQQIADREGITPEEVISQGLDDQATAIAFGTFSGLMDKAGANKVAKNFTKGTFAQSLRDRAIETLKSGRTESFTEGAQTIMEQNGVSFSQDQGATIDFAEVGESMAQGFVGGTALSSMGQGLQALQESRDRSKVIDTPEDASVEDASNVAVSGDPEVDQAADEAFSEVKDELNEIVDGEISDQQIQPEGDPEEVSRVGDTTEPSGTGFSEPTDTAGGFTGFEGETEFVPEQTVDLDEETRVLTPELDEQATESVNNYKNIENLAPTKEPKTRIGKFKRKTKEIFDQFSSNFENFIGEMTENNKALRNQITSDFWRPMMNTLRSKLVDENNAARVIRSYRGKDVDPFKMWAYSFMKEENGTSPEFKINEMRTSARNKGDQKEIQKTEEFLKEFAEKGEDILTEDERSYYNDFRRTIDERAATRQQVSQEIFGRDLPLHNNYVPRIVIGRDKRAKVNDEIEGITDFVDEGQFFEAIGSRLAAPPSGRFKERKGIGSGYYNTNFNEVFSRGMRDLATDVHMAPAVYKMKQILKSPEFQETVGIDNVQELTQRIQYFINNTKGFNRPKGDIEAAFRGVISNIKGAMLSDPSQLFKQFIPGAAGLAAVYATKPGAMVKGIGMARKASDEWIKENAPNLFVRKQSMDHLVESSLSKAKGEKLSNRAAINRYLNISDYGISKLVFFAEYAAHGGTLENINQQALNEASLAQARAQSTNTLATAPKQFVDQKLWLQLLMPFTMMPLNQTRLVLRNLNPLKLGNADRRKMLAFGIANIAIFQAVSQFVIEAYDEIGDSLFGEDDEDERHDGIMDLMEDQELYKKVAVKSAMDATIGWAPAPISGIANQYVFDPVREGWVDEEDLEDPALSIYYGEGGDSLMDALGVVGSVADDAAKAWNALQVAAESGDEDAFRYALASVGEVSMMSMSRFGRFMGSAFGPVLRGVKEYKKSFKEEFKETKKDLSKEKAKERKKEKRSFNLVR